MLKRALIGAAFASLIAGGAQAYTLTCQMTDLARSGNWIPPQFTLEVDDAETEVNLTGPRAVVDAYDFADFKIVTANDSRLRASVEAVTVDRANQRARMVFTVTWIKRTNRASVTAKPLGFTNTWRADGACAKS